MKTYLTYGAGMTLAGALLVFVLYFLGYHSDPAKIESGQRVQMIAGLAITVGGLILGIRARRDEVPRSEGFGYGKAVAAGAGIAAFSALFGAIFNFIYSAFINPGMAEVLVSAQIAKMEEQNMPPEAIESAENIIRMMSSPAVTSGFALVFGFIFTLIIALIVAIFLKQPATDEPPPISAA